MHKNMLLRDMKSPWLVPLGLPVLAIVAWRAANKAGTADAPDSCTDPGTVAWELSAADFTVSFKLLKAAKAAVS